MATIAMGNGVVSAKSFIQTSPISLALLKEWMAGNSTQRKAIVKSLFREAKAYDVQATTEDFDLAFGQLAPTMGGVR
jgi:hypothetical protein